MKNSRLFQIVYLLMERRNWTAKELAERLEVSQRTLYRDIDALSAANIPVYAVKGQGGGIRLMDGFELDRSLLSEEGQEQILTALKSLEAVGVSDHTEVITQLSALFKKKPVEWFEVDFESWGAGRGEREVFELCREAILSSRLLKLEYSNSSGESDQRTVEPLRLRFKGGNWYLLAYCRKREGMRTFRLNRIAWLEMESECFIPRTLPLRQQTEAAQPIRTISLQLKFSEQSAYQVMDSFLPNQIERLPGGGFLVEAVFPPGRWVLGFLLSFGADVEVVRPRQIREALQQEARRILQVYEN